MLCPCYICYVSSCNHHPDLGNSVYAVHPYMNLGVKEKLNKV
jgi:hypothetical protein